MEQQGIISEQQRSAILNSAPDLTDKERDSLVYRLEGPTSPRWYDGFIPVAIALIPPLVNMVHKVGFSGETDLVKYGIEASNSILEFAFISIVGYVFGKYLGENPERRRKGDVDRFLYSEGITT